MTRLAPAALVILFLARTVCAEQPHGGDARVRELVYAADDAYRDGRYAEAAEAFEEAYRLHAQPAILFNVAKCHEKNWLLKARDPDLRSAVDAFRRYLDAVDRSSPKSRHGEAEQALERLGPAFDRVAKGVTDLPSQRRPTARATRLMVGASVPGALVRIDGGPVRELPLVESVAPGKHSLVITRAEYLDDRRDVVVAEGELAPIHAELRAAPGTIAFRVPEGTALYVDGRFVGKAPLDPVAVDAGSHAVALLAAGRVPIGRAVEVTRAGIALVDATPRRSFVRWTSFTLMGLAGLAAGVAIYDTASAAAHRIWASRFLTRRADGKDLSDGDLSAYVHDVAAYDTASTDAFMFGTAAGVIAAAATGLYFFDRPTVADVTYEKATEPTPPEPRARLTPSVGPGSGQLTLRIAF